MVTSQTLDLQIVDRIGLPLDLRGRTCRNWLLSVAPGLCIEQRSHNDEDHNRNDADPESLRFVLLYLFRSLKHTFPRLSAPAVLPQHIPDQIKSQTRMNPLQARLANAPRNSSLHCRQNCPTDSTEGAGSPSLGRGIPRSANSALFRGLLPRSHYEAILKSAPKLRNSLFSDIFSPYFRVTGHVFREHSNALV